MSYKIHVLAMFVSLHTHCISMSVMQAIISFNCTPFVSAYGSTLIVFDLWFLCIRESNYCLASLFQVISIDNKFNSLLPIYATGAADFFSKWMAIIFKILGRSFVAHNSN